MKTDIDRTMERHIEKAFEEIERIRTEPPSEVARYLDRYWDLGDYWREWWQADDGVEWT